MSTKTIAEITPEQKAKMGEYRDAWLEIGLSTGPSDRAKSEEYVRAVYALVGYPPPEHIVWLASPLEGAYAAAILENPDAPVTDKRIEKAISMCGHGSMDAGWLGFYEFFINETDLDSILPVESLVKLSKGIGWWWALDKVAIITERPIRIDRDENRRLHREDGPAVEYSDGWGAYAWHGNRVPEKVILHPEKITLDDIEKESNQEIRRIMIERYGLNRYITDLGADVIDSDHDQYGRARILYRLPQSKRHEGREDMVMVKVINSTPEGNWVGNRYTAFFRDGQEVKAQDAIDYFNQLHSDGEQLPENVEIRQVDNRRFEGQLDDQGNPVYKEYWLRVPPTVTKAQEAVAWTWDETSEEYLPIKET